MILSNGKITDSWYYVIYFIVYSQPFSVLFTWKQSFGGVAKLIDVLAKANVSSDRMTWKWIKSS